MLEVRSLEAGYGKIRALLEMSIEVPEGSVVGIIGANGAGKSTLLRTIAGVLSPGAGSIRFRGEEIAGLPPHKVLRR